MKTDAQKRARNKWNKQHMSTIACSMKKVHADLFKKYAEEHGTTPSTILREYVLKLLEENQMDSTGTESENSDNNE